ncbi:hypothetical protein [Halalkalibacter akibai]|uniref:DUF3221 domain-containing protein n=1 Tax=Halalkalibacter akibai (strain ATCC 43226 / DSM 21942 / CIP 109018 / JCM 9157 / 1139) TaxID=1236973 RepID=W4QZ45_HALA3|nr:hypothetical protein [Halalkalibacter akibai]GAE36923.1 hypothetical protein JCM9157_4159 [Halalkalibacter akibai JCM 9157]
MVLTLTLGSMLSFILPYFQAKPVHMNGSPVGKPDLIGEVINIEEHWLLIDGKAYVDIREAILISESHVRLGLKDFAEGDHVHVWISEGELIGTSPALGTAVFVRRLNSEGN